VNQAVLQTLKATFGFDSFRPFQDEIVTAMLAGKDAFVLMPTGGGKSLCYQLPALVSPGLTVVVSPLIALMKDQVDRLHAMGVAATFINSSLDSGESGRRQAAILRGELKLVYVAPERLMLPGFLDLLGRIPLARFAIDEAHCISEWGHDFRPDYRQLGQLRRLFPNTPMAAFTATATNRVQADIVRQLRLSEPELFRGSFNRPNLFYRVLPKEHAFEQLTRYLLTRQDQSGIIYCLSRAGTESLAARLHQAGFSATAYHAGLEPEERRQRQETFARDDVRIVVATIAFGMGVDKPDVRFVVHYDVPRTLEGYYQESGRAGRDGEPSDCILFFSHADAAKQHWFIDQMSSQPERQVAGQQLDRMIAWAESPECRRRELLAYFDETLELLASAAPGSATPGAAGASPAPCCDNCETPVPEQDYTVAAQKLLSCAKRTGERYGLTHLIRVLTGSADRRVLAAGHDRLPTYGVGKELSRREWRHLYQGLVRGEYAQATDDEFKIVRVTQRGEDVLFRGQKVSLPAFGPPPAGPLTAQEPGIANPALLEELRTLRKGIADQQGVPPYVVFHDTVLRQLAQRLPANLRQLRTIPGVGEYKLAEYGETFLEAIQAHVRRWGARPHRQRDGGQAPSPAGQAPNRPGPSMLHTLDLFRAGASPADIAHQRGLALTTVEGHLAQCLEAGENLDLARLVNPDKRELIEAAIQDLGPEPLGPLKEHLGEDFSYAEIRWIRAAMSTNSRTVNSEQ